MDYYFSTAMVLPGPAFQECTGSCHENVSNPTAVSSVLRLKDSLTVLARILVHYQPSYNTSHTHNETSDPLLLAENTLQCGMNPAGKVDIS